MFHGLVGLRRNSKVMGSHELRLDLCTVSPNHEPLLGLKAAKLKKPETMSPC